MKVRELIEKLQTCDPELEVYFSPFVHRSTSVDIVAIKEPHDPLWVKSRGYIDHKHVTLG